jgi:hypothetical protein
MKTWGSGCIDPLFLTSALVGGVWSASLTDRFTPGTHRIGGWVDPRAGLDDWRSENSWPYRDLNSDSSVVQPIASRYTDWAIPAPNCSDAGLKCFTFLTTAWKSSSELVVMFIGENALLAQFLFQSTRIHVITQRNKESTKCNSK